MSRFASPAALLLLVLSPALRAAEPPTLNLEAQASVEVAQDLGRASFFLEKESATAADAQQQANKALVDAIQQAKRPTGLTVTTTGYHTYPVYGQRNGEIRGWRVRAGVQLESKNFAQLSDTAALLSQSLNLEGVSFVLSRESREKAEASLMTEAIKAFRDKASRAATALGKPQFHLKEVSVIQEGSQVYTPPVGVRPVMLSAKSTGADLAAPPMESGKTLVTVSVRGSVSLD